ncbi:inosine/xanthosine triphosphatase [Virgibacillus profundi]|uniref:inosine/xanthosine triphosphatase n=1 Tax=Virgibacillus profundi TaxID=2024555 RepID=A0A2A2IG61_9BACI|nr:DUF84 family protein [Virgibacillus profundi]PAV30115.1 inosine/xanthosine triphosphatase [Virgibacillus profundi]PXY54287.1 DUF84 domain-containing protein [Virgibacillus profundi]
MEIIIGSKNPTKIKAVQEIFPNYTVHSLNVPSDVAAQPFSDEEIRQGAINRAVHSMESSPNVIGIGLEGGVMYVENQLFLCNWGALATRDGEIFTSSGARVVLPEEIDFDLKTGMELGDVMDVYAKKQEVRKKEGAIGIFTNELVSRQEMFAHVVKLLKGQWEYWSER